MKLSKETEIVGQTGKKEGGGNDAGGHVFTRGDIIARKVRS